MRMVKNKSVQDNANRIQWTPECFLSLIFDFYIMNKETFHSRKMKALMDNIEAHQHDLVREKETLFENPGLHFISKQEKYNTKDFQRAERLVQIIYKQGGMRSISSSHRILHALHNMRNNV